MDNLEVIQQFRKTLAHCIVYNDRAKTASDHKYDGLVRSKATEVHGSNLISRQKFLTDRRTCKNRFFFRKSVQSLRKVTAHFYCRRNCYLVRKTGSHI